MSYTGEIIVKLAPLSDYSDTDDIGETKQSGIKQNPQSVQEKPCICASQTYSLAFILTARKLIAAV